MQSRLKWLLAACALTIAVGGFVLLWSLHYHVAASHLWHKQASTVLQYAIPPVLALFGWTAQQLIAARPRQSSPEQLQEAKKALVGRGLEWWRGIPQPAWPGRVLRAGLSPLDVTWAGTAAGREQVCGRTSDVSDLAGHFRDPKSFRLVIRGPSGSGKSVFARLLMAELLKTTDSGPVPVFLPLWSWDPRRERLHDWIKRRIREDYPELNEVATYGPTVVTNLVDQGMVLPILDGLDSLPRRWRQKVFDDGGLMSQDRLVLTCRTNLPDRTDGFIVITPQKVDDEEAIRFLSAVTTRGSEGEWIKQKANPDFKLLFSQPRLVYMASTICARQGTTPAGLAQDLSEANGSTVEERLLRLLIPALLPEDDEREQEYPPYYAGKQEYPPYYKGKAEEWLRLLAPLGLWDTVDLRHPEQHKPDKPQYTGMSCIAWWNLHRGVPYINKNQARLRAAVSGLIAFLVIYLIFLLDRSWHYALLTSASYGFMVFFAGLFLAAEPAAPRTKRKDLPGPGTESGDHPGPRHPALAWWLGQTWGRWRPLILAGASILVVAGLLLGFRVAYIHKHPGFWYWTGIKTGFFDGLNDALIVVFTFVIAAVPRPPRGVWAVSSGPAARSEARNFMLALLIGIPFGLEWGISAVAKGQHPHASTLGQAVVTGLITGIDFAIGAWLFHWSGSWSRSERAPDPRSAARADLVGALLRPLILGFTFAFAFGISAPFNFTTVDVWAWFVVGLAIGSLETEWPLYAAAIRTLRGGREQQIPVRLMRFLECCRGSGLLSSIGQAYQIHDDGLLGQLTGQPDDQALVVRPRQGGRMRAAAFISGTGGAARPLPPPEAPPALRPGTGAS